MTTLIKDPEVTTDLTFDYVNDQRLGDDTIVSADVTISLVRYTKPDPDPSSMLITPIVISGTQVSLQIKDGVLGNKYHLKCLATTSGGQILDQCGSLLIQECND